MITRIKLKNKINKILKRNFGEDIPIIQLKKNNKEIDIYYFRDSPKYPTKEQMKIILELGLNKNLRNKHENTDVSTIIYTYSISNNVFDVENVPESKETEIIFDKKTCVDWIKSPHFLINGATGTGKTYFLLFILSELVKKNAELVIIDGKHADLEIVSQLYDDKKKRKYSDIQKIQNIYDELINRQNYIKIKIENEGIKTLGKDYRSYELRPIFLVIDEYASFVQSLKYQEKENKTQKASYYESLVQEIVAKGRSLGIFVILASQRFSTKILNNDVRSNFGAIISLGNEKNETNLMLFNTTDVPIVKGRGGLLKSNEYQDVVVFQTPIIKDLSKLMKNII